MSSSAASPRSPSAAARSTTTSASYRQYTRAGSSSSATENLPPRTLARVAREVRDLHKNPPENVRLVVDPATGMPNNLGELMAELEGPVGTPYEGKYFVLKLVFGHEFPAAPPRGFFLTKMYHPNVDMSSGAICVNTLKKDWTVQTTLSHVLNVIRCLLIVPFPESSLNDEAGRLFMESYDEYSKRARLMADVHGRNVEVEATSASASAALPGAAENGSANSSNMNINGSSISSSSSNSVSSSGRSRGVLKSSLDSTNNTTVTCSVETGSSASTAKKQKGNNALGKLGKKKSLKRL